MGYLLKKHNFFGEKFESDIIRTAKSKQKSKEVFLVMTKKQQPFQRGPLLGHQQNKDRGRMSRWCSPKITHNIHGNQANNNTKINIGQQTKFPSVTLSALM